MTNLFLYAITHTARMQLAGCPDHPRAEEYARTIDSYRAPWAGASAAQKKAARTAALKLHDMTDETVDAAIAALEG